MMNQADLAQGPYGNESMDVDSDAEFEWESGWGDREISSGGGGEGPSLDEDYALTTSTLDLSVNESVNTDNVLILAKKTLPSAGHTPDENGENPGAYKSLRKDVDFPAAVLLKRYNRWIKSMPKWRHDLGKGWVGKRVLGRGGFGIAGLWEYIGKPEDKRAVDDWHDPQFIVVKQQRVIWGKGLKEEAAVMKQLKTARSRHIPRLYKRCYREAGANTPGMRIDSSRREVHRIFMEFCPGGDMHDFINTLRRQSEGPEGPWMFLREDKVWAIFICLIKALMVVEYGTESLDDLEDVMNDAKQDAIVSWPLKNSVHFDIKPGNIFVGKKQPDERPTAGGFGEGEHVRMPAFKLGDYGMMTTVPEVNEQTANYVRGRSGYGTRFSLAPEQQRFNYSFVEHGYGKEKLLNHQLPSSQRKYGPHTNVYQIGTVMYSLMTLYPTFPERARTFVCDLNPRLMRGETIGESLVEGVFPPNAPRVHKGDRVGLVQINSRTGKLPQRTQHPYSKLLSALVLECLMQDYRLRPGLKEILERANDGYEYFTEMYPVNDEAIGEDFEVENEPREALPRNNDWRTDTPLEDWKPSKYPLGDMLYRPLSIVLRRQEHDRKRFAQVREARRKLGWLPALPRGPLPSGPVRGMKRALSKVALDHVGEVDTEDMSILQLTPMPKGKGKGKAKAKAAPIPRPKPTSSTDRIMPAPKKQRVRNPTFILAIQIYNTGVIFGRQDHQLTVTDSMTILELKESVVATKIVLWPVERLRVARRSAAAGEPGYDLSDRMDLEEAAQPREIRGQELRRGDLVFYLRPPPDDVEMADQ